MATRALLSYSDRLQLLNALGVGPTISATGSTIAGWEPANVSDLRTHKAWQVPSGGPHTLTYTFSGTEHIDVIAIIAPPDKPFVGTPQVRLRNNVGSTIFTSTTSVRPPFGLTDRRFFVMPSRLQAKYIDVTLASGSFLGYCRFGWAVDLSAFMGRLREWQTDDTVEIQDMPSRAVYYRTSDTVTPARWLSYSVPLGQLPASTIFRNVLDGGATAQGSLFDMFDRVGRIDPVLFLPYGESDTAQTENIDLMHCTGMYGRLVNDLVFSFDGSGKAYDDLGVIQAEGPLRSCTLDFEALI